MTPAVGYGVLVFTTTTRPYDDERDHLTGFMVRQWAQPTKFAAALALEALERVVPPARIQGAAAEAKVPTVRRRKLSADVTLLLCLAMSLWTREALDVVLHKLMHGLLLFWPDPDIALATKSAISQARYRLVARPVVALFHQVCWPLATEQTPGAFRFGLRLGQAYKAIHASIGPLCLDTLQIATTALESADPATYARLGGKLTAILAHRDALAQRMLTILEGASFGNAGVLAEAGTLIGQAEQLVGQVRILSAQG